MSQDDRPQVDIIIVNWNTGERLRKCLKSIRANNPDSLDINNIIVVDNASSDNSAENITSVSLPITKIENDANRGFAAACNQGAERGNSEYLLFLNPDTEVCASESLATPIHYIEDNQSNVAIVGTTLKSNQKTSPSCYKFPSISNLAAEAIGLDKIDGRFGRRMDDLSYSSTSEVDQVMGAFFLVQRSVFEDLDGFDERFFVYYEEVDFSLRANQNGWETYFVPSTGILHEAGGSSHNIKSKRLYYSLTSRIKYFKKHYNLIGVGLVLIITLFLEFLSRLSQAVIVNRSTSDVKNTINAYWLVYRDLFSADLKGEP